MAIFGEIGKKISQTAQSAAKGTKDLAGTAKLNMQISDEQKLIDGYFMQIGKSFYELHSDTADENFASICTSITESMAKIAQLREEIQKIKGIKKCTGCGAEIPIETTFCGVCGYDTRKDAEAAEQTSDQTSNQTKMCPSCNKELASDAAFCTDCGQKL